ncbi:site-specific DNA-methyltransferase [Selenomonas sp. oral taxon 138]|uniref:site-specific DNA-methyltransferase n=1 Tax=Selenomonas sp. oral taxon 138 TaxID=712532 RepID=UPI00034A3A4F|nr:site-specific DNA-methyltransferase [Selenomonas sp. oral taxon 138]
MKKVNDTHNIRIERIWSMPNKNTFEMTPIKKLLSEEVDLTKMWVDPFANRNRIASITNDLSKEYDTDYHMDALDFLNMFDSESVDGVLYDPPYSPRQVSECYNSVGYNVTWDTTKASFWGNHKRAISRIVKLGGKVITFGWNSGGIGYKYGFEIERILLIPHGGWHNDTICTVEVKTHKGNYSPIAKSEEKQMKAVPMLTSRDMQLIEILQKLPTNYWDFKEEDTKTYTHGIHNYPAMMVSPISRNIIKIVRNIQPVKSIFDPFAGSGTVLVEGMLSGMDIVAGNDINPFALLLCKAKTTKLDYSKLKSSSELLLANIHDRLYSNKESLEKVDTYISETLGLDIAGKKGWADKAPSILVDFCNINKLDIQIPDFKNIGYWFRPRVILELAIIKSEIYKVADFDIRDFMFVAMSESIRLVSNRRNGEFKMFRMPAPKVLKFNPDVYTEFADILLRNVKKMQDFSCTLAKNSFVTKTTIYNNNTCTLEDVPDNTFDLVITSPPYGDSRTTVAYGEYSRLSLQWINPHNLSEKEIMRIDKTLMGGNKYRNGFEFSLQSETLRVALSKIKDIDIERAGDVYSFYKDLDASIKSIAAKTKSGGYQFWVVGNRTVKNELLQTDVIITELASQYGLVPIYIVNRNIPNKIMPFRNSPTNEIGKTNTTMTMEHIVILRKK